MARYAKFITALIGAIGLFAVNLLTPADAETAERILTAVVGLLTALGVYQVPNAPSSRHTLR